MDKVAATLIGCLLATLALLLWLRLDTPVERVVVSGSLLAPEQAEIRRAVLAGLSGGMLGLDLAAIRDGILALSWPQTVSVRRRWPDTLVIDVEKAAVVAQWQQNYLTSDGRVVSAPHLSGELPRFECENADPVAALEMYHRLSQAAAGQGLGLRVLEENALGEWSVMVSGAATDDPIRVMLGARNASERFQRFLLVFEQALAEKPERILEVDARYDNGVAVSWRHQPDSSLLASRTAAR